MISNIKSETYPVFNHENFTMGTYPTIFHICWLNFYKQELRPWKKIQVTIYLLLATMFKKRSQYKTNIQPKFLLQHLSHLRAEKSAYLACILESKVTSNGGSEAIGASGIDLRRFMLLIDLLGSGFLRTDIQSYLGFRGPRQLF